MLPRFADRVRFGLVSLTLVVSLASCGLGMAPTHYNDICSFVRASVTDGSFPLSLAQTRYPECNINQGPTP